MNEGLIACPNCGHEFEMSEALAGKLRAHLKTELQADIVRREAEVKKRHTILAEKASSTRSTFATPTSSSTTSAAPSGCSGQSATPKPPSSTVVGVALRFLSLPRKPSPRLLSLRRA